MSITPQAVFMYLGVAALVVAVVFVGLAAYTFVHEDIRGVMDDLSGRRRAAEVGMGRGRRRVRTGGRRRATDALGASAPAEPGPTGVTAAPASSVAPAAPAVQASPSQAASPQTSSAAAVRPVIDDEDAAETIVDEDLGIAKRSLGVDFGRPVEEDDVLTQVASDGQDELEATAAIAGTPDEPVTRAVPSGSANESLFRVTRRIISVSSPEVISER